jgi:N-acetylglucosaminyldiphosphoundecaprenol N-acetyl-beta-D-mannosaminyltransferase
MGTLLHLSNAEVPSFDVLGCSVHALTAIDLTDLVEYAADSHELCVIANHNLHSVYLYQRDEKLREFFSKAKWTHADGMGVVLLGRVTGAKLKRSERTTYVDWLPMLLRRAADRNWRVFYLGSKPGVAEKGTAILRERFPGLQIVAEHGYFDATGDDNERILGRIKAFSPNVLLVGMGMPRQEHWINDNLHRLDAMVLLPCGCSMDYVAGEIPTPPRWAGRWGLEWLFRLFAEPTRLWKRYLIEPSWILCYLLRAQWLRVTSLLAASRTQAR